MGIGVHPEHHEKCPSDANKIQRVFWRRHSRATVSPQKNGARRGEQHERAVPVPEQASQGIPLRPNLVVVAVRDPVIGRAMIKWHSRGRKGVVTEDTMSPDDFRTIGHQLIDWIADYRAKAATFPVMARTEPGEVKAKLPASPPEVG